MNGKGLSIKELRRAAALVEAAMLSALPEAETAFSPAFEEKMAPLLRRAKRRASVRRALQAAAVFFLALLAGATVYLAAVPEARASVVSWMKESSVGRTNFRFSGEEETGRLPNYRPTWLPEGFELAEEHETKRTHTSIYRNKDGVVMIIRWHSMSDGSAMTIIDLGESYEKTSVQINGMYGEMSICSSGDDTNYLWWIDEEHNTFLYLETAEEETIILHIAESIILEE